MSLIPTIYNYDPWYSHPPFGIGVTPHEIYSLMDKFSRLKAGSHITSDEFLACIDVKQFKPNEITVKTVDNTVIVEGKHEDREDEHGYISRQFVRKYTLPDGYDPKEVVSTLSSDGILTIKAPRPKAAIESGTERTVQIQQTGPAHLNVKENPKEDSLEEKK